MRLIYCWFPLFASYAVPCHANTEKTIFIAPGPVNFIGGVTDLKSLRLTSLTPTAPKIRTSLKVAFPDVATPRGVQSWYLLRNLSPGQRYELRICWAAIQPTEFWIETYSISQVFDTPNLTQRLSEFSHEQSTLPEGRSRGDSSSHSTDYTDSALFLHVHAAADFFTSNKTLMQDPPLVDVDIILDPYVGKILPQSLIPTVGYIVVLAVGSWFVSNVIWTVVKGPASEKKHID